MRTMKQIISAINVYSRMLVEEYYLYIYKYYNLEYEEAISLYSSNNFKLALEQMS